MNMRAFFSRLYHYPIPRRTAVMLLVLVWSCLACSCSRNNVRTTEIDDAAKRGDLEKVKALLVGNTDLVFSKDKDDRTPLHFAAAFGKKDVVELLLANKADVNAKDKDGDTPLQAAAARGHTDVVELLRRQGGHE
jgi:ankyrin repeat protein